MEKPAFFYGGRVSDAVPFTVSTVPPFLLLLYRAVTQTSRAVQACRILVFFPLSKNLLLISQLCETGKEWLEQRQLGIFVLPYPIGAAQAL